MHAKTPVHFFYISSALLGSFAVARGLLQLLAIKFIRSGARKTLFGSQLWQLFFNGYRCCGKK
jgi:hypothetical protein